MATAAPFTPAANSVLPPTGGATLDQLKQQLLGAQNTLTSMGAPPKTPTPYYSSADGAAAVQKATQTQSKLSSPPPPSPTPPASPAGSTGASTPSPQPNPPAITNTNPTTVKLINPSTEQTVSFTIDPTNPDASKSTIQAYLSNGYSPSDISGTVPDWLAPGAKTSNPTLDAANTALTQATNDLAAAKAKITSFDVSNDPALQSTLSGITNQWDSRIQTLKQAQDSELAALKATGIRLGSQYTGGMFGSIISGEENASAQKIADLQAQKQQALTAATAAYSTQKWSQYMDLVKLAQDTYTQQLGEVQKLQTAQATQDKTIQDKINQNSLMAGISSLMKQGITDPASVMSGLSDMGVSASAADLKTAIDLLNTQSPTAKNLYDILTTAAKNGAPDSVLKSVGAASNATDAIKAAGSYMQTATGSLGDYLMYQRQAQAAGQTPMGYQSFLNAQDYNKAYATAKGTEAGKLAATGGVTSNLFDSTTKPTDLPTTVRPYAHSSAGGATYLDLSSVSANSREALIAQAGSIPIITDKNQAADLQNQKDAISKLNIIAKLYSDIASPSAAARDLGGAGLTKAAIIAQTNPEKAAAQAVNDSALDILKAISGVQGFRGGQGAINQIKEAMPTPTDTQDTAAQKLQLVAAQIQAREESIVGTKTPNDYTNIVVRNEDQAKNAIVNYGKQNPEQRDSITKIMGSTNPDTGEPYSYLEAAQILGIDIPAINPPTPFVPFGANYNTKGFLGLGQ